MILLRDGLNGLCKIMAFWKYLILESWNNWVERPHIDKLALMAAKWLARVGGDEPFVVRNCRYEIRIIGVSLNTETCMETVKAMNSLNILW